MQGRESAATFKASIADLNQDLFKMQIRANCQIITLAIDGLASFFGCKNEDSDTNRIYSSSKSSQGIEIFSRY